jgi:hypothetical protein
MLDSRSRRPLADLLTVVAALLALAPGIVPASEDAALAVSEPVYLMRVPLQQPGEQLRRLQDLGFDIASFNVKTGVADLIGGPADLERLQALGLAPTEVRDQTPTAESIAALSDYLSPTEINTKLEQYASSYPNLAVKLSYSDPTQEGRTVQYVKISDNPFLDEDEPRIVFVSQHHAREVMTPEVAIDIIDYLLTRYGTDVAVTEWVNRFQIYVVPTHNPDGANYMFTTNNNWRKNRRNNGDGTFGVDLNRNYPFLWGPAGCGGSSGSPGDDTYRGPSGGSEPENQGFMSVVRSAHPSISLSYHTYGEYVLHPYGCDPSKPDPPDLRTARDTGSDLAASMVGDEGQGVYYKMGTPAELLYSVDGDTDGWAYGEGGALAFTIELNADAQGFQPDYASWRDSTVQRARGGWQYLIRRLDGPSIDGHVLDACTGEPLGAQHRIMEQTFTHGESPRATEPVHGRFRRIVDPGDYSVEFSAGGHRPQIWPFEVRFAPATKDVFLVATGSRGVAFRSGVLGDASGDSDAQADPGEQVTLRPTAYATGEAVTNLRATLTSADPYVTVTDPSAAFADLAGGVEAAAVDPFGVTISPDAPDGHVATLQVAWSANEVPCRDREPISLRITRGVPSCPEAEENLDSDPGWTIENSDGLGWDFGPPQGSGGTGGPNASHTGEHVYGTNLAGNYGNNGFYRLTSTPFDLRGLRNTELRYWRWLNNEPGYDPAKVEVSSDGLTWHEVWKGFGRDRGWEFYRFDASSIADLEDAVRVRFTLTSDSSTTGSGFYVDDLSFCGEAVPGAGGKLKYESHVIDDSNPNRGNGNGVPDVGETVTMPLTIRSTLDHTATGVTAILRTSTAGVVIHDPVAYFPDIVAGGSGSSIAPHFTWTPSPACGDAVLFEFEARWGQGESSVSTFTVHVGSLQTATVLNDDFETDRGWTTAAGAGVKRGFWVREDPYGVNTSTGVPVQPEDDHTPAPGTICWVTGNPRPGGNFTPTMGDVDGGNVDLLSPVFDGARAVTLDFQAARWFHRSNPTFLDGSTFTIDVSNDAGTTWSNLERLTSNASAWQAASHDLNARITPSAQMRLRIRVNEDLGGTTGDTLLEGLVDDVKVTRTRYECSSFAPPSLQRPNPVGNTLRAERETSDVRLSWAAPPQDATHGAATLYRVYRAAAAGGSFIEIGSPTAAFFVDLGAARTDQPDWYYRIVAENSGGSE